MVGFHWSAAQFVPNDCLDTDLCVEMLRQDYRSLRLVPENFLPTAPERIFCDRHYRGANIVRELPRAWVYVPQHRRKELLRECIVSEPDEVAKILAEVPEDYLDEDVCLAAIRRSADIVQIMQHVPDSFRTRKLCKAFTSRYRGRFEDLPKDLQFENICIEMALAGLASISRVPPHLRTPDVYEMAEFNSLVEIPEAHRSDSLCMKAVKKDGRDIRYVPIDQLSDAIVRCAVTATGTALQFVPQKWINDSIVAAALHSDPVSVVWAPEISRGNTEFVEAAKALIGKVEQIPAELLDHALVIAIVTAEGRLLIELPLDYYTPEICKIAFDHQHLHLSMFPDEKKTREACLASVRRWWRSLGKVPQRHLLDGEQPDICETAIGNSPFAFKYVPKDHSGYEELRALAIKLAQDRGADPAVIATELG